MKEINVICPVTQLVRIQSLNLSTRPDGLGTVPFNQIGMEDMVTMILRVSTQAERTELKGQTLLVHLAWHLVGHLAHRRGLKFSPYVRELDIGKTPWLHTGVKTLNDREKDPGKGGGDGLLRVIVNPVNNTSIIVITEPAPSWSQALLCIY